MFLMFYHCDIIKNMTMMIINTTDFQLKTMYMILLAEIIYQVIKIKEKN